VIEVDEWWYCEPMGALIQGSVVSFRTLVSIDVEADSLVIRRGEAPDDPLRIPLDKLVDMLVRQGIIQPQPEPPKLNDI
jgi:hypothetical protein